MEFKEVVTKRRSVRKFSSKPIEREKLEALVEVALQAPSSRNSHSTSYLIVTGEKTLARAAEMRDYGSAFLKGAPAAIFILGDRTKSDLTLVNSSISATLLQLAIIDAGLASCWIHVDGRAQKQAEPNGAKAEELLREFLPIPEQCEILCCVALGYSDFTPAPLPEYNSKDYFSFFEGE